MSGSMKSKSWDLIIYFSLAILLILWAVQIRATCEEIGCLAVVVPIIGIMIITPIEFLINLVILVKYRKLSEKRWVVFVLTCIVSLISAIMFFSSYSF